MGQRRLRPGVKWVRGAARTIARNSGESARWGLEMVAQMIVNDILKRHPELALDTFTDYHPSVLKTIDDSQLEEFSADVSELAQVLRFRKTTGRPEGLYTRGLYA